LTGLSFDLSSGELPGDRAIPPTGTLVDAAARSIYLGKGSRLPWLTMAGGTSGAGGSISPRGHETRVCSASLDSLTGVLRTTRGSAMSRRPLTLILFAIAVTLSSHGRAAEPAPAAIDFDRQIAPLLVTRCLACHCGAAPDGGLSLVDAAGAAKGGERGPALEPGTTESLLWQRVEGDEMPPDQPLPPEEKALQSPAAIARKAWPARPADRSRIPLRLTTWSTAPTVAAPAGLAPQWPPALPPGQPTA